MKAMARGGTMLPSLVGRTPVLPLPDLLTGERVFWAKLEGHNPGGIKDRPALHMIDRARRDGRPAAGAPVVESTSGTLGLGLALAGRVFGHPVVLVVGLVLGVRDFSQRGLFLIGGTLADRLGYKPMIMIGCGLRVEAFAVFNVFYQAGILLGLLLLRADFRFQTDVQGAGPGVVTVVDGGGTGRTVASRWSPPPARPARTA